MKVIASQVWGLERWILERSALQDVRGRVKEQNQETQCSARASALEALVQKCISEHEGGYYCVEDACVVWLSYRLSRSRKDTAAEYRHQKETELEEEARSTELPIGS